MEGPQSSSDDRPSEGPGGGGRPSPTPKKRRRTANVDKARTIFVARYLRRRELQREITEGLNIVEAFNGANSNRM